MTDQDKKIPNRPRKFTEDTIEVKILLPRSVWNKIKRIAAKEMRSASDLVRIYIKEGLINPGRE